MSIVLLARTEQLEITELVDVEDGHVVVRIVVKLEASNKNRSRRQLEVVVGNFDHIAVVARLRDSRRMFRILLEPLRVLLVVRFLLLLVRHVVGNLHQRLAGPMVHLVPADRVLEEIRVVGEVPRAVLAQIRSRVGVDVGVLLQLRRRQEALLADITFERALVGIGVDLLVDLQAALGLVELQALIALKVARLAVEVLVAQQVGFLEEAFITLRAVVVAVLDVVRLLVVHQVHLLEELFLADLAAELRLLQVHLPMGEQAAGRLQHLSAVGAFLFRRLCRLRLQSGRGRVTTFVLQEALQALKLDVALAADLPAVHRRLVVVQLALLRVGVGAVVALVAPDQMSLEVVAQQNELLGIVVAHDARENHRLLLV